MSWGGPRDYGALPEAATTCNKAQASISAALKPSSNEKQVLPMTNHPLDGRFTGAYQPRTDKPVALNDDPDSLKQIVAGIVFDEITPSA